MNILRLIFGLKLTAAFFALWAAPSFATPPLFVQSQDHPIAVSHTHLYVMRHVTDNMGRYQAEQSKTYILKLETKTSKLVEFHKLQDAIQGENESFSKITANNDFNLFTYLENEKAFQIGLLKSRPYQKITVDKKDGFYLLSRDFNGQVNGKYHTGKENSTVYDTNLRTLLKASLSEIMSDYIGPVPDSVPNKEIYSLSQNFDPKSGGSCHITKVIAGPIPIPKWTYEKRSDEFVAYVTCLTDGESFSVDAVLPLALNFNLAY